MATPLEEAKTALTEYETQRLTEIEKQTSFLKEVSTTYSSLLEPSLDEAASETLDYINTLLES